MNRVVPMSSVILQLIATLALLLVGRAIYRITLHPLAKFPGPKAAAISSIFAMSYDLPARTSFVKSFSHLHDKYGPIIRIEPNHLHIRDMDAYNQVFKVGTKFTRDPAMYGSPFTKGSMLNVLHPKDAKPHRDMYMPYFSRDAVRNLEPVIRQHLYIFLQKLDEQALKDSVVDLTRGFRCLSADTIMRYCYDKPYGATLRSEFKHPMLEAIEGTLETVPFGWYFPKLMNSIVRFLDSLPRSWIRWNEPITAAFNNLDGCKSRIIELKNETWENSTPSVFKTAFNPKVEKGHPSLDIDALKAEAFLLFVAGTDTTANTLTMGTWHLLKNKTCMQRLQSELREAIPQDADMTNMSLDWISLEKLDFLRAVIKESLRLSFGVPGKLPRIVPSGGATLAGQHIPGGTAVSMACYTIHQNPEYFPDSPNLFKPERWLDPDYAEKYEKNLIPFSRGSRNCIGQNLAWAQLYYTFAYVFRHFDMEIFETTDEDMDWHDAFIIATFGHLKVKLQRTLV